jgi:small subunit ribosomal protein S6
MYILDPLVEGEERKELIEHFTKLLTDNGAVIEKVDEWGKRRLAYPINFKNDGYYVLVNFSAGSDVPKEIERNLKISDKVMRSMVVKIEEKKSGIKPRAQGFRPSAMVFDAQVSRDRDDRPERAAPIVAPAVTIPTEPTAPVEAAPASEAE